MWQRTVTIKLNVQKSSKFFVKNYDYYWYLDGGSGSYLLSLYQGDKTVSETRTINLNDDNPHKLQLVIKEFLIRDSYYKKIINIPAGKDIYEIEWTVKDAARPDCMEVKLIKIGDYQKNAEMETVRQKKAASDRVTAEIESLEQQAQQIAHDYFWGIDLNKEREQNLEQRKTIIESFTGQIECIDSAGVDGIVTEMTKSVDFIYTCTVNMMANEALKRVETSYLKPVKVHSQRVLAAKKCTLFHGEYGTADAERLRKIRGLNMEIFETTDKTFKQCLSEKNWNTFSNLDVQIVYDLLWFCAMKKPYVHNEFEKAKALYKIVFKGETSGTDIFLAEIYAKFQMAGSDGIHELMNEITNEKSDVVCDLHLLASGLMWMKAYREENTVLQLMLKRNMVLTEKEQERLHILSVTGGDAPDVHEIKKENGKIYFDAEALAWRDNDYAAFFDNLAFQGKKLDYQLAIRDENRDLLLNQAVTLPAHAVISRKLQEAFDRDYSGVVYAEAVNGVIMSGSGKENLEGILVTTDEVKNLGLFVHTTRIGRKLNIKFYTLFMPQGAAMEESRQKAISMYKKLSPTITIWESSLKDAVLEVLQHVLNYPAGAAILNGGIESVDIEF